MRSIHLQSPAKINPYLKILNRRQDGYHRMITIFHRVSFCDQMTLKKTTGNFRLRCSHKRVPVGDTNLITQAYNLLKKEFPSLPGVSVHLKKKIPMGAGLGGGSSNAAFFLLGMIKLCGLKISKKRLYQLGKKLGADVPFFLANVNQALGTDRGDQIQPKPISTKLWFLLVLSNKGLSTGKVFQKLPRKLPRVTLTKANQAAKLCSNFLKAKDLRQLSGVLGNDLEGPAFQIRPSLRIIIKHFESEGVLTSRMSGSGATVFAIFKSQKEAKNCLKKMRRRTPNKKFVICHTY